VTSETKEEEEEEEEEGFTQDLERQANEWRQ
jgi:hypothetical protein